MTFYREEKPANQYFKTRSQIKSLPTGEVVQSPPQPSDYVGEDLDLYEVIDSASSAKVIPEFNTDLVNKKNLKVSPRFAGSLSDLRSGISESVKSKSKNYRPYVEDVDLEANLWTFSVGDWQVVASIKYESENKGLNSADLHFNCSCPFWRWQGPEHWGSSMDYLHGDPRGSASTPVIRDPYQEHNVCKHVYAVLGYLERVAPNRRASFIQPLVATYLFGRDCIVTNSGIFTMCDRIVSRYLRRCQ